MKRIITIWFGVAALALVITASVAHNPNPLADSNKKKKQPLRPALLAGQVVDNQVVLTWRLNNRSFSAPKINGYQVYRGQGNGALQLLTPTPILTEAYTDKTAQLDQSYIYKVAVAGASSSTINFTATAPQLSGQTFTVKCDPSQSPCDLASALAQVKSGRGDTILLSAGTYKGFVLKGMTDLTIKRADPSQVVKIGQVTIGSYKYNIRIENSSRITFEGLQLNNTAAAPSNSALFAVGSSFLTIRNSQASYCVKSCFLTGDGTNHLIYDNNDSSYSGEHGIYISESADVATVSNNNLHDNTRSGLQVNAEKGSGEYGDGISAGITISNNTIHDNGSSGLNLLGVQDSIVQGNTITNNGRFGIANAREAATAGPRLMTITDNTIIQKATSDFGIQFKESVGLNKLRNNVIIHPSATKGAIVYSTTTDVTDTDSDDNTLDRISVNDGRSVIDLKTWQSQGHEIHSNNTTPALLQKLTTK